METKERIIAEATELFMKEGVKRVTMDKLAASLGMSKRTIYENYKDKDQILRECIETHIKQQRVLAIEMEKKSETAIHFFFSMMRTGIENMKGQNPQFINDVRIYHPAVWKSTLSTNRDYNLEQTNKFLQRGISEGVFIESIDIPIISKIIYEIFSQLANSDMYPPHIYPTHQLFEQTTLLIIRGISSRKGLEIIDELTPTKQST